MKKLSLALAAALSLFGMSAEAQQRTWPNWYVGIHARMAWVDDTAVNVGGANVGDAEFDNGYGAGASFGYMPGGEGFWNNTRFELEYSHVRSDFDTIGGAAIGDDLNVDSYMANAFYDIPTGTAIVPYIGAGAGWASVDIDVPQIGLDDDDTVFAYQFMGGLGYQPSTVPNTTLTIGYRYFATEDPEFSIGATRVDHEVSSHNLEVGARFAF